MKLLNSIILLLSLLTECAYTYAIYGVHAGINKETGERPFRYNLEQFKASGPAWDLYIIALKRFMDINQSEKFSYFKIAGVHGVPTNTPWDDVVGTAGGTGYCEHGSVLFPVWHRPYLALFEEKIWDLAQKIAGEYPEVQRAKYKAAALRLRIPFWDWSLSAGLPDVLMNPQITVNAPGGQQTIDNPLYAYKFHPLDASKLPYFAQYSTTVREPNLTTKQSQNSIVDANLRYAGSYWHDQTYLLLTSINKWTPFSNMAGGSDLNLELLHGGIHNFLGGLTNPGHMTYLWYSAFDPVFWLHHAQVDRLVAIWQAIHPYEYIEPGATTSATYFVPQGTIQNVDYPLVPFRRNDIGFFHTGKTVRRLKTFGYSYPELVYWSKTGSDVWALQKEVIATVNKLYHPNFGGSAQSLLAGGNSTTSASSALNANWEWKLSLKTDRDAISTTTVLFFFLSGRELSANPDTWDRSESLVGRPLVIPSANTSTSGIAPSPSSVPLTSSIMSQSDLSPTSVLTWVNKNLIWRALNYNLVNNPVNTVNKLASSTFSIPESAIEVILSGRQVTQPADEFSLPQYAAWKQYGIASLVGQEGNVVIRD